MSTALFRISLSLGRFFSLSGGTTTLNMRLHCFLARVRLHLRSLGGGRPSFRETQVVTTGVPQVFLGHPSGHTGVTLVPILRTKGRPNVQSPHHTRARCFGTCHVTWTLGPESRSGIYGPWSKFTWISTKIWTATSRSSS